MSTTVVVPSLRAVRFVGGVVTLAAAALVAALAVLRAPVAAAPATPSTPPVDEVLIVDVNEAMESTGTWREAVFGGVALEPFRYGPARIFRYGPSDREAHTFYLEDPTSPTSCWGEMPLRLSPPLEPWVREVIYEIDGDLRVENDHTLLFFLDVPETLGRVTLRVRGDVYITDDLRAPPGKLRIEALARNCHQGGHIFLRDERFGTLDVVEAELIGQVER